MGLYRRKDSAVWWMSYTVNRRTYYKSTDTENKRLAETILGKIKAEIVEGRYFDKDKSSLYTYEDLVSKFMSEYATTLKPNTERRYKVCLPHLDKFFKDMTLDKITSNVISDYIHVRREEGASASTINKERNLLSKAFNLAIKPWKIVRENPCDDVAREQENNEIIRWLTGEEEERLVYQCRGYLNGDMEDIVIVGLYTGMRQMEILTLNWRENIDIANRIVRVSKTKNGEPRSIPMNNIVYDILFNRSKVRSLSGFVFTTSEGTLIMPRNLLREFYKAREKAGIPDFRFHDLRHTFATRLIQAGVDIYTVAKLLGHKDLKSTMRYAHLNANSMRQSVNILDSRNNLHYDFTTINKLISPNFANPLKDKIGGVAQLVRAEVS